ncbi:MAG: hypothetical protein GC159_01835 [Phycisphaera sp.]|nr:hypothetical protein [Phycisphaera sp.]
MTPDRDPMTDAALLEAIWRVLDGTATDDEVQALEADLASSEKARGVFRRCAALESQLDLDLREHTAEAPLEDDADLVEAEPIPVAKLAPSDDIGSDRRAHSGRARSHFARYAAAAAFLIAAALAVSFLARPRAPHREASGPTVATVVNTSSDVAWTDAASDMSIGSPLGAGTLTLSKGSAQLLFTSGAVVNVTGPARFELHGDNSGRLHRGVISAHVPSGAHGFAVEGPEGVRVVDLGTAFAMNVDDADKTRVCVLEGVVRVERGDDTYRLEARQALHVDVEGNVTRLNLDSPEEFGEALADTPVTLSDTFATGRLPAGWEAVPPALVDYADGHVRFTSLGDPTRCYLRTQRTDWLRRSFVAEVTMTVGDVGAHGGIGGAFFGFGTCVPGEDMSREPQGPSVFAVAWPDDFRENRSLNIGDFDGTHTRGVSRELSGSADQAGSGTHRLRMIYDAVNGRFAFSIDRDYHGGPFVADFTSPWVSATNNGFDDTNSRLFIGGGYNARFGDIVVHEYDLKATPAADTR